MNKHNTVDAEVIAETPFEEIPAEEANSLAENPEGEILSEDLDDFDELAPKMNVSVPAPVDATQLIPDDQYLGILRGIIDGIHEDRKQVSDYVDNFADMVINGGDATTSSKEAFVNLVKVKTDLQDKMLKAAELMTRLKMKNTYAYSGPHLNALQQNNYNINSDGVDFDRKELIRAINHAKKKKKD